MEQACHGGVSKRCVWLGVVIWHYDFFSTHLQVALYIGNFGKALGHYETAVKLKPQLVEALVGLGICATRLQRWSIAHSAAVQLLKVQPHSDTARMLMEQAVYATL